MKLLMFVGFKLVNAALWLILIYLALRLFHVL